MLLAQQVEVRRLGPAERALVGAGAPPGATRVEVFRALPSVLGAEDRAFVLQPLVQRARPARPAPFVRVEWIAEVVVVAIRLPGELGDVAMVAVHRPEPPGPVRIQVELGLAR